MHDNAATEEDNHDHLPNRHHSRLQEMSCIPHLSAEERDRRSAPCRRNSVEGELGQAGAGKEARMTLLTPPQRRALRAKVGADVIRTVHGIGYALSTNEL